MSNVYFKEDPQQIVNVANRLQQQRAGFSSSLNAMQSKANGLKSHWSGDGMDAYRKKIEDVHAQGSQLLGMLDDFVRKLQEASGIYTAGEQTAKTAAEGLPTTGVFR